MCLAILTICALKDYSDEAAYSNNFVNFAVFTYHFYCKSKCVDWKLVEPRGFGCRWRHSSQGLSKMVGNTAIQRFEHRHLGNYKLFVSFEFSTTTPSCNSPLTLQLVEKIVSLQWSIDSDLTNCKLDNEFWTDYRVSWFRSMSFAGLPGSHSVCFIIRQSAIN